MIVLKITKQRRLGCFSQFSLFVSITNHHQGDVNIQRGEKWKEKHLFSLIWCSDDGYGKLCLNTLLHISYRCSTGLRSGDSGSHIIHIL